MGDIGCVISLTIDVALYLTQERIYGLNQGQCLCGSIGYSNGFKIGWAAPRERLLQVVQRHKSATGSKPDGYCAAGDKKNLSSKERDDNQVGKGMPGVKGFGYFD